MVKPTELMYKFMRKYFFDVYIKIHEKRYFRKKRSRLAMLA